MLQGITMNFEALYVLKREKEDREIYITILHEIIQIFHIQETLYIIRRTWYIFHPDLFVSDKLLPIRVVSLPPTGVP